MEKDRSKPGKSPEPDMISAVWKDQPGKQTEDREEVLSKNSRIDPKSLLLYGKLKYME